MAPLASISGAFVARGPVLGPLAELPGGPGAGGRGGMRGAMAPPEEDFDEEDLKEFMK